MREFSLSTSRPPKLTGRTAGAAAKFLTVLFWVGVLTLAGWSLAADHFSWMAIERVGRAVYLLAMAFLAVWGVFAAGLGLLLGGGEKRSRKRVDLTPSSRKGFIRRR